MESLGIRQERQVYLLTYSRANMSVLPSRLCQCCTVVNTFETTTVAKVLQWVVSLEQHNDASSEQEHGYHYHMAVKLSRKTRWPNVCSFLDYQFRIQVNFSAFHSICYSAYRYTVKEDAEPLLSDDHPDLKDSGPRTENAISHCKRKSKQVRGGAKSKKAARKRMSI